MANSRQLNPNNEEAIVPIPRKKKNKKNKAALQPIIQSARKTAKLQATMNAYLNRFREAPGQSMAIPMPLQPGQTGHHIFLKLKIKDLNNYATTSRQAYVDVREWQRQNQPTLFGTPLQRTIESAQSKVAKKSKKANSLSQLTNQASFDHHLGKLFAAVIALSMIFLFSFLAAIKYIKIIDTSPLLTISLSFALFVAIAIGAPLLLKNKCAPALSKHFTEAESDYNTTAQVLNELADTLHDTPISEVLQQINQRFGEHEAAQEEDAIMKMEAGLRLSDEPRHDQSDVADEETPLLLKRK